MINFILGFLIGSSFGSFIKAWADRSLDNKSILGRSYCPSCKHKLGLYDLFPVFSYLALKGKCRYCKKKISLEYLFIEVLMGLLLGLLFFFQLQDISTFSFNLSTLDGMKTVLNILDTAFKSFLISVFIAVFLTDLKTGFIPDRITYPSIIISFLYLLAITPFKIYLIYLSAKNSILGNLLVTGEENKQIFFDYLSRHAYFASEPLILGILSSLGMVIFFGSLIIITKGRGMGGGDFKLGILMGLGLGFPGSLLALLIAFITGAIVGVGLILFRKKDFGQTIPFGPFLSLGSIIVIFYGNQILDWYFRLRV